MDSVNPLLVFYQGIISFLSPCILSVLPLYMGYLSQNAKITCEDGSIRYHRKTVLLYTVYFVLGVSAVFFIMAFALHSANNFFEQYRAEITFFGAIVVIVMGLVQLGVIQIPLLARGNSFSNRLNLSKMNAVTAFLMGFLFSFSWTPCIMPMLTQVILMAASSTDSLKGVLYIVWYALGFLIPFMLVGLFTTELLKLIKEKRNWIQVIIKTGGVIMIAVGIWMGKQGLQLLKNSNTTQEMVLESPQDFILKDQYGNTHQLSKYKGKAVVVTFVSSWCKYCALELEDLKVRIGQDPAVEYLVVIQPGGQDLSKDELIKWAEKNGYTMPILFDEDGQIFAKYGVTGLPTNYFIYPSGEVYGYAPGYLEEDKLNYYIEVTKLGEVE